MSFCKFPVNIVCPYDEGHCDICKYNPNSHNITTTCPPDDHVNHPSHYTQGGVECIEAIKASMPTEGFQDYCKGNVMKYIWRWREKGGVEDLEKARVYLSWLIGSANAERRKDGI